MLSSRLTTLALLSSITACGPATPHHMTTAEHEAAADMEDRAAVRHSSGDDAVAASAGSCGPPATAAALGSPCWATDGHPYEDRAAAMEEHRGLAAAHRAAADDLRLAEARACVGVSDDDRDASPFDHHADVSSVSELREEVRDGSETTHRLVGATIVFRAVRGLSSAWLERVLECHLARNASLGHDVPEMADCPLVPSGVTVNVRSLGGSFAVDVRAEGDPEAAEVLRRARTLVPAA